MEVTKFHDNVQCPYCGCNLNSTPGVERTEEHVIGRRFIPKGYLEGEWHLIIDSCCKCNVHKANLESGLSLISHLAITNKPHHPPDLQAEIQRKLGKRNPATGAVRGATHPETNRPVVDSFVEHTISGSFGPAKISFSLIGPPQALKSEMELAQMHIQAFYYLLVNGDPKDRSNCRAFTDQSTYLPAKYIQVLYVLKQSDWGNEAAQELATRTKQWKSHCLASTAQDYFKVRIRRESDDKEAPFFWALEWNRNVRILGMIRDPQKLASVEEDLPALDFKHIDKTTRYREEKTISNEDDILFG